MIQSLEIPNHIINFNINMIFKNLGYTSRGLNNAFNLY